MVLLLFSKSMSDEAAVSALSLVQRERALFDDHHACFFGVTCDPQDVSRGRIAQDLPGIRYLLDFDRKVSSAFGAARGEEYSPHWALLDPTLRVVGTWPLEAGEQVLRELKLRAAAPFPPDSWAPVLMVPDVIEPELCRTLINLYEASGGKPSGFMREVDGKTKLLHDPAHKQRRDHEVEETNLRRGLAQRVQRRLLPAVKRAFQFDATRMERYLVACYEAGAGHFRPHRDNTTPATAHRRFAVTINLNATGYDGGDLRFPEFGRRSYRAPTGGAIVFSCSLLHEATPVTSGRRYAFLPFLYDEEGAQLRESNNRHLDAEVGQYRRG
jgi:predicted 2-oxoglutarate/Fe(II)-dependent dioxygenase YbiX